MIQVPIYRIVGWEEYYEYSRTKRHKKLSWVRIGNNFDGDRITDLISQGGAEAYGCFVAMVLVASRCEPRGNLMNSQGKPHTPESLHNKTRLPAEAFACTLDLCVNLNLIKIEGYIEGHIEGTGSDEGQSRVAFGSVEGQPRVTADPEQGPTDRQTDITNKQQQGGSAEGQPRVTQGSIAAAVVSQEDAEEGPTLSQVEHELSAIGMDALVIPKLTASHPYPKILEAISMVKARGNDVKNRAGLVRAALDGDWQTEGGADREDAYEANRKAEHEARERRRQAERQEETERQAQRRNVLDTLAALPPGEFETLKALAYTAMPAGLRKNIAEDSDPLEHGVWRSFMWAEYEKRHTASQSDDLIPGGV